MTTLNSISNVSLKLYNSRNFICVPFSINYTRDDTDLMLGLQNILKKRAMIIEVFFSFVFHFGRATRLPESYKILILITDYLEQQKLILLSVQINNRPTPTPQKRRSLLHKFYYLRVQYYFQIDSMNHVKW